MKPYVIMSRSRKTKRKGFYIVKFESINELAGFITCPENAGRIYKCCGVSRRQHVLLSKKLYAISRKKTNA